MRMRKMKKKRKNRISFFIVIILLIFCVRFLVSFFETRDSELPESYVESQNVTTGDEVTTDSIQEIRGTIKDATKSTLTIYGEDGCEYYFGTEDVEMSVGETGLMLGNPVSIQYSGKLDSSMSVQDVNLLSIIVTDAALDLDGEHSETIDNTVESVEPSESSDTGSQKDTNSDSDTNNAKVIDDSAESAELSKPSGTTNHKAEDLLNEMTLEEKVGQMFIARCPETDAAQKADEYHLGGYILFGQDFSGKTKDKVIQTIQSYQDAVEIPLFIGVDEEGGTVNRVSRNSNLRAVPFWAPQALYAEGGFDLIRSDTQEKCKLLHSLGINLNFAPVCDVSQDPNDFIYDRSFGQDADQTADYVQEVVETMVQKEMGCVLKHFPGYGNNSDTHTGIAYDNRTYETFLSSDFLPFQAGIDSGANMVLVSHNVVACMDEQFPASLSPQVHSILREELGFTGVVITDDLSMEGVRDFAEDTEIAIQAVRAGNDMLCCTDFEIQIPAVIDAVKRGEISEQRIDESVMRILELKILLNIM